MPLAVIAAPDDREFAGFRGGAEAVQMPFPTPQPMLHGY
jgi:hypothetical protein